jgi:hypothetical protein
LFYRARKATNQKRIEQSIQSHEEERLRAAAVEREAAAAEIKQLDEEAERLMGKYVMEVEERRRQESESAVER